MNGKAEVVIRDFASCRSMLDRLHHMETVAAIRKEWPGRNAASLNEALLSLDEDPARCPVIRGAQELGFPARHLLYGKGRGVYRIIFSIREDEQHHKRCRGVTGCGKCKAQA